MPTMTADEARERAITAELAAEQAARDAETRAAKRAEHIERERVAKEAADQAARAAKHAAYLAKAEAAYEQACSRYKTAVDEFRAARATLHALDILLERQGFGHSLGVELRHATAAPDEGDVNHDIRAALDSMRRTLGS
jgi:hypothetical protein